MIRWQCVHFSELNTLQLYKILRLRSEIFVVEQNCVYQDMDGLDTTCFHFCGWQNDKLIAYTRLIPRGISYADAASIGRVVVSSLARGKNVGRQLMQLSIGNCERLFGAVDIKISAQFYLKKFYESLGFLQISEIYLEDGIEHIGMIKTATGKT